MFLSLIVPISSEFSRLLIKCGARPRLLKQICAQNKPAVRLRIEGSQIHSGAKALRMIKERKFFPRLALTTLMSWLGVMASRDEQLALCVHSDFGCPLNSHGVPPVHRWACGLGDALVAVRLLRVLAVLRLGAVLRARLLPQRAALLLLQLQVGAREGVKDGRDRERHEEDAAQDAAERHHLAGDAPGHHVSVADGGHGDHGPPVAAGDAGELLLGAQLALGQEHQRGEESHGDAEEQQEEAEFTRAPLHRQPERLQTQGVARQPHHVKDPQRSQDPEDQAHLLQVVVPGARGFAAHRHRVHNEGDVVGEDGHHVDDVQRRAQEHALSLRLDEAQHELQREPGDTHRLQHKDVITPLGALTLRRQIKHKKRHVIVGVGGSGGLYYCSSAVTAFNEHEMGTPEVLWDVRRQGRME